MSQTIRNCFEERLTFDAMLAAHKRARQGKANRGEVLEFEFNLEHNLVNLVERIRKGKYQVGDYREFYIYEPKERLIKSLPYIDRVVHQWYVHEFIIPYFLPKFIKDIYACIKGRGTHKAVTTMQTYMRAYYREQHGSFYILKLDIKKFFFNIDQQILRTILNKYIQDKKLKAFTKLLIVEHTGGKGLPIGNYTSQFFANIYLMELDYFVKHKLRIKYYVRYMDDFVLLVNNKRTAQEIYKQIKIFLNKHLKLELNPKSNYYPSSLGVDFCGYRIWCTHRLLRQRSKQKMVKQVKAWTKLKAKGCLEQKHVQLAFNSWLGHAKHADTYRLRVMLQLRVKNLGEWFNYYYK